MLLLTYSTPFLVILLSLLFHLTSWLLLEVTSWKSHLCSHLQPVSTLSFKRRSQGSLVVVSFRCVAGAFTTHSLPFTAMPVVVSGSQDTPSTSTKPRVEPSLTTLCDNRLYHSFGE